MNKKPLILIPALITCVILFSAQSGEQFSTALSKAYNASGFDIDIDQVLGDFKNVLVKNRILNKKDLSDASSIYRKLSAIESSVDPTALNISYFIDKKPLNEALKAKDVLSMSLQDQANIALFTYYQLYSAKHSEFILYLDDKRLLQFDGEDLPMNSFESVIFEAIAAKETQNVTSQNAKIIIEADPRTPTEFVHFITSKLREMNLRSVAFQKR